MLGFDFDLGASSSIDCNMAPVRKRLESESESPPSLAPSCDLSVSSDENYRDPAPATTQSRTSAKKLPFSSFSEKLTSYGGSSHDGSKLELTTVVKELQPTNEKKVRFDTCTVRFMPRIAGDHPDCVEGPPVSYIVWTTTSSLSLFSFLKFLTKSFLLLLFSMQPS
jgi:hypothetical protein